MSDTKIENKSKKRKSRYFEIYISKVLKHISSTNGITANAKQQLNSAICIIARRLSSLAFELTQKSGKKTLSQKEIFNAVKILLEGEILHHCLGEAEESENKFMNDEEKKIKNVTRQERAGIIFPPSIAEKFLRNFGYNKLMITKNAPIAFATILEYITVEILRSSIEVAERDKHIRITVRDLEKAVCDDNELDYIFKNLGISFIGGLSQKIIHKTKKTNNLTFTRQPFERYIRKLFSNNMKDNAKENVKVSRLSFLVLQYFTERFIIDILKQANNLAVHAGRVKVMRQDLLFVLQLNNIWWIKIYEEDSGIDDNIEEENGSDTTGDIDSEFRLEMTTLLT